MSENNSKGRYRKIRKESEATREVFRKNSDTRSFALSCNKKMQTLWGGTKIRTNGCPTIEIHEAEAYSLDIALRIYWELQTIDSDLQQEDIFKTAITLEDSVKLRQLTLEALKESLNDCVKEYTFEYPDPLLSKEKEEDKRLVATYFRLLKNQQANSPQIQNQSPNLLQTNNNNNNNNNINNNNQLKPPAKLLASKVGGNLINAQQNNNSSSGSSSNASENEKKDEKNDNNDKSVVESENQQKNEKKSAK